MWVHWAVSHEFQIEFSCFFLCDAAEKMLVLGNKIEGSDMKLSFQMVYIGIIVT